MNSLAAASRCPAHQGASSITPPWGAARDPSYAVIERGRPRPLLLSDLPFPRVLDGEDLFGKLLFRKRLDLGLSVVIDSCQWPWICRLSYHERTVKTGRARFEGASYDWHGEREGKPPPDTRTIVGILGTPASPTHADPHRRMLEPLYRAVGPDAAAAYTDPTTFSPRTDFSPRGTVGRRRTGTPPGRAGRERRERRKRKRRRDGVASGRLSSRCADQRGR